MTSKIYWVTDMNTEECYAANFDKLKADLANSFDITTETAAETLRELGEDETIQFTQSGKLYEVDIEVNE